MTPERWKQIEDVFQTAVDLPPRERRQYIVEACTGDDTLREQVEHLVAQHDRAGDFIEEPAIAVANFQHTTDPDATTLSTDSFDDPSIGRRVGVYRILREIGRGGMGAVFEAVHESIGQRIAIKVLNEEYSSDARHVQRFFDGMRAENLPRKIPDSHPPGTTWEEFS